MATTPGIVQDGQKYISEAQSQGEAMMTDYENEVQILSQEALGMNINSPSELDMGLKSLGISSGLMTSEAPKPNYLMLAILAGMVYFLFIKKGKRK